MYKTIKKICEEKHMSIRSLEQKAGLGNGTISKWEKSNPSIDKVNAVAKVLDVSIEALLVVE